MRFSEAYSVDAVAEDDWFDAYLPADSKFCIDPFLIYESNLPEWSNSHTRILGFFAIVFELVRRAKGNKSSPAWKQAEHLLLFPEPAEFCLGVTEGSPLGAGSGPGLRADMLDGISVAVRYGLTNLDHMEMLALFHGGMGFDRISDSVCNILKSDFIKYTQSVCARHDIPTRRFRVQHADWSEEFLKWQDRWVELPINPFLPRPYPVLLTPQEFLRDIPVANANGFWEYAWRNHAEELRNTFNYDVARNVPRQVKARLARRNISVVEAYFQTLESTTHDAYPLESDPKLLMKWYESGAKLTEGLPSAPASRDDFMRFSRNLIESFKRSVEDQGSWELLWSGGRGRAERAVQRLFQSIVVHYCRANNIDLSPESNAGRGPVDFKFSQGWGARIIVEMKLMRNSKFWDGILAQAPQYAKSEEVTSAFFVAVAYTDDEMSESRVAKIAKAAKLASAHNSIDVIPIIIDARPKESASNLKASPAERNELHGRQRDTPDASEMEVLDTADSYDYEIV